MKNILFALILSTLSGSAWADSFAEIRSSLGSSTAMLDTEARIRLTEKATVKLSVLPDDLLLFIAQNGPALRGKNDNKEVDSAFQLWLRARALAVKRRLTAREELPKMTGFEKKVW